jgi:hypothetical protein
MSTSKGFASRIDIVGRVNIHPRMQQDAILKVSVKMFLLIRHPSAISYEWPVTYASMRALISNPLNHYNNASWKLPLKALYETAKI